jgi:hypothetical protein
MTLPEPDNVNVFRAANGLTWLCGTPRKDHRIPRDRCAKLLSEGDKRENRTGGGR